MAQAALSSIPCQFEAGNTVVVTMPLGDFLPADGNAALYLSLNGATPTAIAATESGANFTFTISAATSATLAPGTYDYAIRFTYTAGEVYTVTTGQIAVLQNIASAATPSQAQTMVTLLNTVLQTFAGTDKQTVNFNGQSFSRFSMESYRKDLVYWESRLLKERREDAARRGVNVSQSYGPSFANDSAPSSFCGCR